ncbi:MAG: hypothetical protein QM844_00120 [Planctomycetota bacterium]|jgi:hypothetical protein|nr:hypothetical protein [Planctomycetota bacterium]
MPKNNPHDKSQLEGGSHLNLVSEPGAITIEAAAETEATADGKPKLPQFTMVAYTGGPMRIAGWRYPVVVDLAGMAIPSQNRPIRFGHDMQSGVGHTKTIRIEDGRLLAAGVVSRDTAAAREVVVSARNGFPWQASIGASVEEFEFIKENQKAIVNGREFAGPINVVRKSLLGEISFVDLGADGQTSASVAATAPSSQQEKTQMDESKKTVGANQNAATDDNATETPADAEAKPASTIEAQYDGPSAEQIRAEALAESNRISEIRRHCEGQYPEIEARAIREGWTADRCQTEVALEALRRSRPKAPAAHFRDNTLSGATLEAACLLTAGLEQVDQIFDGPTIEAASRRFRGGIGLQELLLEAAWANGYTGRNFRDSRSVLRFAFRPELEAGFSTIDIGGILSNVANKFLLDGFFSVERTWRNICATRNVSDFKTVTSYRLIGADQYEQVAPGGELKHGTLGQEQYTNKADTYGLMLSIDRRDIINDDLGAITTVPRKLGRGSGLKINDIFWATFLNNSTFFTVGNKNYVSGADTVLSIDGLTKGEVTFMDQVDPEGKPIGIMPAILLVPTALSAVGSQLYKSMELRDTTASTKYPVSNPHQGKFRVEVSRYLSNSQYAGNSSKAWYLLAEPGDLPVIEVAFLNGQESPTIETADADFSVLGVQMRGYHDFGVGLQDPRGGIKAKGEA